MLLFHAGPIQIGASIGIGIAARCPGEGQRKAHLGPVASYAKFVLHTATIQ